MGKMVEGKRKPNLKDFKPHLYLKPEKEVDLLLEKRGKIDLGKSLDLSLEEKEKIDLGKSHEITRETDLAKSLVLEKRPKVGKSLKDLKDSTPHLNLHPERKVNLSMEEKGQIDIEDFKAPLYFKAGVTPTLQEEITLPPLPTIDPRPGKKDLRSKNKSLSPTLKHSLENLFKTTSSLPTKKGKLSTRKPIRGSYNRALNAARGSKTEVDETVDVIKMPMEEGIIGGAVLDEDKTNKVPTPAPVVKYRHYAPALIANDITAEEALGVVKTFGADAVEQEEAHAVNGVDENHVVEETPGIEEPHNVAFVDEVDGVEKDHGVAGQGKDHAVDGVDKYGVDDDFKRELVKKANSPKFLYKRVSIE